MSLLAKNGRYLYSKRLLTVSITLCKRAKSVPSLPTENWPLLDKVMSRNQWHIRIFHSLYKVGRNGNFVFKGFDNSKKGLPPVGLDLMPQIITGLGVQCLTKWTKQAFACKSKTLRSLYSHALLIIAKSSQFLQVQKSSGA